MRTAALRLLLLAPLAAAAARAAAAQAAGRDTLRIVAVGDLNLARAVARDYVLPGRGAEVFAAVAPELERADLAIGNLESAIVDRGAFADTALSPTFAAPAAAAPLLAAAGFAVLGTANNHAWDLGQPALLESLARLDSAGIAHAGTGPTPDDAYRPAVARRRGWTVAVFAVTAIFNYPDLTVLGHPAECCVAWADTLRLAAAFRAARAEGADLVLVLLHAGLEYRDVPPSGVVRLARGIARAGADAVIGAHPHVPQGMEWVDGRPIVYSLGNFVFAQRRPWTRLGLAEWLVFPPAGRPVVTLRPVAVGERPAWAARRDSIRTMAHFRAISDSLAALPRSRAGRNVAPPLPRSGPR